MRYPTHLLKLIDTLKKLPGVGGKTAERFAFQMITWSSDNLKEMAQTIALTKDKLKTCPTCHCLIDDAPCPFCQNPHRDASKLCLVSSVKDVYLIESTQTYNGLYYVLDTLLSPADGLTPNKERLNQLKEHIQKRETKECILALDATLEGDATALFLAEELQSTHIKITRLALGLPIGTALDFIDGGTLAKALQGRETL